MGSRRIMKSNERTSRRMTRSNKRIRINTSIKWTSSLKRASRSFHNTQVICSEIPRAFQGYDELVQELVPKYLGGVYPRVRYQMKDILKEHLDPLNTQ